MFKKYIRKRLEKYVRQYFKKHPEVKLVVIAGSVGKTSTKHALAALLSQKYRVAMEEENHNTELSVPTSILGVKYPDDVHSVFEWLQVFRACKARVKQPTGTDIIIQEIGADHPGDIAAFGRYLHPELAIITGVTPEHMEFFETIESVAKEELTAANFSHMALINRDDIAGQYAEFLTNAAISTYGTSSAAEYYYEVEDFNLQTGYKGQIILPTFDQPIPAAVLVFGEHSLRPVMAAVAASTMLGLSQEQVVSGLSLVRPVSGRMNVLSGMDGTIIIDDTYNSSPAAVEAALQTLYSIETPQRIALLGSMNELGTSSQLEHQKVGALCDPGLLAWVVTVGDEAEKYLAPFARQRGNQVKSFKTAIEAGAFIHTVLERGAVVLAKGSQNGGYLEESVKVFLEKTSDDTQLVRQSIEWMHIKNDFFKKYSPEPTAYGKL